MAPDNLSKKRNKKKVELMSPAGNIDTAVLALESGADAVYAGVTNLSMRPKRVEFSQSSFEELIDTVHGLSKKIYATMNVCPKPSDVNNFKKKIDELHQHGVDAVIVSDVGMMNWIHNNYPGLPIHASIMTSVVNVESARFYKELGASVIVVSRSLADIGGIKEIHESVDVDLEVFVHGGICYMFDGICYMSSYWKQKWDYDADMDAMRLVGQNNTKGECHLICKRYGSLTCKGKESAGGKLMRRPDDVGLDRIPYYLENGIGILKIEGRAMPAYYIEQATKLYRQAIDLYLSDPDRYTVLDEWTPVVEQLLEARRKYERKWDVERKLQQWEKQRQQSGESRP